ncbi:MAG: glycosyltransferase family 2 protein [Candidatus Omnitrophica bacterium]|nr:glycosyltransferase family 2 protein [Candidatus Omnitrophota bacterium]
MGGSPKQCDIVIPVWNQRDATRECLEHIAGSTDVPYRVIIIDNGSGSETRDYLAEFSRHHAEDVVLVRNENNLGFIKAVNQGMRLSDAPYVCIMNNDTIPGRGWLGRLIDFARTHDDVGLVNPLCGGHQAHGAGIDEYADRVAGNDGKFMEMNQCQGFCMLIKREVIDRIGYLDERFGMGGFDDTDYSMRAHKAGYRSIALHSAYVYHKEHTSFRAMGDRKAIQAEAEKEYFKKWPRHLRVAFAVSVRTDTQDEAIRNMLLSALMLAREWCWMNLMIAGGEGIEGRIRDVMRSMDFPEHQNIKISYLPRSAGVVHVFVRIAERAFGTKRRKKYDAVVVDGTMSGFPVRAACLAQGGRFFAADFNKLPGEIIAAIRPETGEKGDMNAMKCDIILPVCDQYEFTKNCIESIIRNTDTPYRLIVINNGTNESTRKLLAGLEQNNDVETTIVHNASNIGWVKALNKGIELSRAPYVCFQNDDTVVTRGWLRKMIRTLELRPDFGIINPSWEGRPKRMPIDRYGELLTKKTPRFIETDWARGFSVVVKRRVIDTIGPVDEQYSPAYFDDVDYSVTAIEAGFRCLLARDTYVYHHRNVTFFEILKGPKWNELHEKNKLLYYRKWGRPLKLMMVATGSLLEHPGDIDRVRDLVYGLARNQHRVYVWTGDRRVKRSIAHTNVMVRYRPRFLLPLAAIADVFMSARKRPGKRYDAIMIPHGALSKRISMTAGGRIPIFSSDAADFDTFIRQSAHALKEKTKTETYGPL